jgi:radical SAM-linked protein
MRIRFTYQKTKPLRYTSTLDIQLIWERACRRAKLPIAYTQGFHPQARIQQAFPLPLGFTSNCELVDIWFENDIQMENLTLEVQSLKTLGIEITSSEIVPENSPSLQKEIEKNEYRVYPLVKLPEDLVSRIDKFLSLNALPRIRNGKPYDIRPLVISLVLETTPAPHISMLLSASGGATARPEEVISSLEMQSFDFEYLRTKIIMKPNPGAY